jgi:SAM-dependent methyltransferase
LHTATRASRRFDPGGTLLDVGEGNGFVCRGLLDAGFDTALLEPGPEGAANGKASGIPQVVCSTLEAAHFEDGSVSAGGLFDVIEHIPDDLALLTRLHRVIRAGGRLFITVPAGPWLWSDDDNHTGHYRRYRLPGLCSALTQSGFEVEYAGHLFAPLVLPLFLLKSIPSRLGARSKNADLDAVTRDHSGEGLAGAP